MSSLYVEEVDFLENFKFKLDTETSSDAEHSLGEELTSLRISLEDILKATNNFAEENLLKRSGKADVYKGLLLRSEVEIDVVIRKYRSSTDLTFEFYMDIKNISCVKHKNVVSLIGFCDEEDERMIVMEYVVNESLDKYLSDPTTLWSQRLYMCLRAACGLCYWKVENLESYYAKNFKVLLNKDKEVKLLICIDSLSDAKKSQMYTLGVFLLEVLYGKKATTKDVNQYLNDNKEGGPSRSSGIEDTDLNTDSLSILKRIIYECLDEGTFYQILMEQLNEAFKIQWKHENPWVEKFANLKIPLSRIKLANWNCTTESYRRVYKGQLPKRRIIINRLYKLEKTPKDFFAEIEKLSSCKHPNVASLLGYCDEGSEMILVFECRFKETLDDYLGSRGPALWGPGEAPDPPSFWFSAGYICFRPSGQKSQASPLLGSTSTSTRKTFNLTWEQRIRICLDIAHGLEYLQNMEGKSSEIYHGIISANVFLDEKWTAKMASIRVSKTNSYRQPGQRLVVDHIYLLGQVLFEILTGRSYKVDNFASWAPDRRMTEETHECGCNLIKTGLNQDSLNVFFKIAYQCLEEIPSKRPALEDVIKSLKSALQFQITEFPVKAFPNLIPLSQIIFATENFHSSYCVGSQRDDYVVYKAELDHFDMDSVSKVEGKNKGERPKKTVIVKRVINGKDEEKKIRKFFVEVNLLTSCKHPNLLSHHGFCVEDSEMIIVFECGFKQTLDDYLRSTSKTNFLTWEQRIRICLDIAHGLKHIHSMEEGIQSRSMIHERILSTNVLLDEKWNAKIARFRLSKFESQWSTINTSNGGLTNLDMTEDLSLPQWEGALLYPGIAWENDLSDVEWHAKMDSFRLSRFDSQSNTINTSNIGGRDVYLGSKHLMTENANVLESIHIYSLGVILFEMLTGRLSNDSIYMSENANVLESIARKHLNEGTLNNVADPRVMEEAQERGFTTRKVPGQDSFDTFSKLAYQCLVETPSKRPTLEDAIKSLEKALHFQVRDLDYLKIELKDIQVATNNFEEKYCIGSGEYGKVYECSLAIKLKRTYKLGEMANSTVTIKRIFSREVFLAELDVVCRCEHPNIVSLLGFCDEDNEMLLVYEHASKGSLHDYLGNTNKISNLTWEQCLKICIGIAHGLSYTHTTLEDKISMAHHNIKSTNILLGENWEAKITDFWFSEFHIVNHEASTIKTSAYLDPKHAKTGWSEKASDIYSFGVILFEIFSGKLAYDKTYIDENDKGLAPIAQTHFKRGTIKEMLDPKIMGDASDLGLALKLRPDHDSVIAFSRIAYQCLAEIQAERPTIKVVIEELNKAIYFQKQQSVKVEKLEHLKIPLKDILSGTHNFSQDHNIGSGGYGSVYRAELKMKSRDGLTIVAIKRIKSREDSQGREGFLVEIDALSKCQHPNIISLLGFCVEDNKMLLVYEHASHGSLDSYLGSPDKMINLTWAQRLKMCIGVAKGLNYLHTTMEDNKGILHRDIKSGNILLDKNWEAKIADFGLSKFCNVNQEASTINTMRVVGTGVYLDPEYARTGRLKKASDIYSLGVVLFEIFSGTLAYDSSYTRVHEKGLAPIVRKRFRNGTIKEMLDSIIMDEASELSFTAKVRPDHDSLDTFLAIAHQCIAKSQADRPTIKVVINELEKALYFHENRTLKISLDCIRLGTGNFSDNKIVMSGGYGKLYKGKVQYNNREKKVAVKRFSLNRQTKVAVNDTSFSWENGFLKEFEVLFKYKHENIVSLVGYCKEMDEKIIVYEHTSNKSLDRHLNDTSLSWSKRLKICIDIAKGLKFLHGGGVGQDVVIHRDLKSSNILLTKDWKAKISGFEHALSYPTNEKIKYVIDDFVGSPGYCDPLYWETHTLTKESDIYSLGVILFEILCGRLAYSQDFRDHNQFLDVLVKSHFQVAQFDDIVFDGLKEQIEWKSLVTFRRIAFQCLHAEIKERPTADEVVVQLQKALEFQGAYELPEGPKLKSKYQEILQVSESREINASMAKRYIADMLSKGILTEDDKLEIIQNIQRTTTSGLKESVQHIQEEDDDHLES